MVSYSYFGTATVFDSNNVCAGFFMVALTVIGAINTWLIIYPSHALLALLELMHLPQSSRIILVLTVIANVALSVVFERVATNSVGKVIGRAMEALSRNRVRGGKVYKAVESGMR